MIFNSNRLVYTIVVFVSIVFLPWYIYLTLLCIGTFVFRQYSEAVVGAVVADLLFGFPGGSIFGLSYTQTIIVGGIFLLSLVLRNKLRFIYDRT
jgi:hypothetical protein